MSKLPLVCCLVLLVGCSTAFERGLEHQLAGERDQARNEYLSAGARAGALYNLAILEEDVDADRAQLLYRQAIELDARLVGAWVNGVRLWQHRGQADSAQVWADHACRTLGDHPEPFVARALLRLAQGEQDAGRDDLLQALDREPQHVGALALLLTMTSEPERRARLTGRLNVAASARPATAGFAGKALRAIGEDGLALTHLQHAVLLDPLNAELLLELGLCLAQLGYDRDAVRALWRAEAAGCDDAHLHIVLAELYLRELDLLRQP